MSQIAMMIMATAEANPAIKSGAPYGDHVLFLMATLVTMIFIASDNARNAIKFNVQNVPDFMNNPPFVVIYMWTYN